MDSDLEIVLANFSRVYLGGIPAVITSDSAFLAFICILTATEALCGYRYGREYDMGKMGGLFKSSSRITSRRPTEITQISYGNSETG
jgi:hypothetical protein